jgi:hypothetical protein
MVSERKTLWDKNRSCCPLAVLRLRGGMRANIRDSKHLHFMPLKEFVVYHCLLSPTLVA